MYIIVNSSRWQMDCDLWTCVDVVLFCFGGFVGWRCMACGLVYCVFVCVCVCLCVFMPLRRIHFCTGRMIQKRQLARPGRQGGGVCPFATAPLEAARFPLQRRQVCASSFGPAFSSSPADLPRLLANASWSRPGKRVVK